MQFSQEAKKLAMESGVVDLSGSVLDFQQLDLILQVLNLRGDVSVKNCAGAGLATMVVMFSGK